MDHNEWGPDDMLDKLLDFEYSNPAAGHRSRPSKGLRPDSSEKTDTGSRSYGLGSDAYNELAGAKQAGRDSVSGEQHAHRDSHDLHYSDASASARPASDHRAEIMPRHARPKTQPQSPEEQISDHASGKGPMTEEPQEPADTAAGTYQEMLHDAGSRLRSRLKNIHASELAAEAIGAAKKLASAGADEEPEQIPPASVSGTVQTLEEAASEPDSADTDATSDTEERDEVTELFRELGEPVYDEGLSADENQALRQAQQDAYERYSSNYSRKIRKQMASGRAGVLPRWISRLYVIAMAAFAGSMTIMNVLPFGMLIAFYVVIGLLSIILLTQLRKRNIRKWVRGLAGVTAVLLIGVYGVGTAYSMGTLSFLDFTSVENENRVASITKDPFNAAITGIDAYGKIDGEGRSDVNMIVTVNPVTEQILMTSIPRDYEIYMPDKDNAVDKLTHTGFYGVSTTIGAEENLLDTKINYYVKVNFTTVKGFIYAIGGIDVYSDYEFTPVKRSQWTVKKGWNHMDGKQALAFARERKAFVDGDRQRIKNQQAVFEAIIKKATSSKTMLLSYNKILSNLRDYFQMSFSSSELRSLMKLQLAKNPDWKIYKNTINGGDSSMKTYSTGGEYAYVMSQDQESIDNAKSLINAVLEGRTLDKDEDGNVIIAGGGETSEDAGSGEQAE